MNTSRLILKAVASRVFLLLAVGGLVAPLRAAVTNTVPWAESFEAYTNGMTLGGTNGWAGQQWNAGVVTTDTARASLLAAYLTGSRSYPLPAASHTNILTVSAELVNRVCGATGGVVAVDFMMLPTWSETPPTSQTNDQCAFYVATNGQLTVWHCDRTVNPATNVWLTLTNSPVISTSAWSRLTVIADYTNHMFQVRVNEAAPLIDGKGWQQGGVVQGGSWFRMVKTNGVMAALAAEASPAYLDDLVAAQRQMTWSRSNFTESVTNNGSMAATPLVITLKWDTFTGTVGDNLVAAEKLVVANLPSNLVAVATLTDSATVSLVLTNTALAHEAAHSFSNLSLRFTDAAFTLGQATDVLGYQVTNAVMTFSNTPSLGFSKLAFAETIANDGSLDNTSPLWVTLTNAVFAGTQGENLAADSLKLQVPLLPAGLSVEAIQTNSTQVVVRLLGKATQNDIANNLSTLQFQFQAGAFDLSGAPVSSVLNLAPNMSISFIDPSTLTYGTTAFSESVTNDGTVVQATTLTLVNKTFDAAEGEDLALNGKITSPNLPPGLVLHVVRGADAGTATLSFGGAATAHEVANSVANLQITLADTAVAGGNAAGISNYSRSDLSIAFTDARTLSYSSRAFTERSAGLIDNRYPPTIKLSGDTFTGANGDDFVAQGKITVSGLPPGLVARVRRETATQLSIQLSGAATSHASTDSTTGGVFTFQNGAFTAGYALYVGNYQVSDLSVTFNDLTGIVNLLPFEEPFEDYALGQYVSGYNGWLGDYADDVAMTTNDAAVLAKLPATCEPWGHEYPITGTHTQVLYVQNNVYNEVHSQTATNVFVDFLAMPMAVEGDAESDTNDQCALFVTTNGLLKVWQHDPRVPTNTWLTLSNAPVISTSAWVRFTIESNYTNQMFQVRINESYPITDPNGWTLGGQPTGSWFRMVQTNGTMSRFKVTGDGVVFLDDFSVRTELPVDFGPPAGSIFLLR